MPAQATPEEITELVLELGRNLTGHFDAQLAELDLTVPQAMLLRQLGDAMPMRDAAARLHCDASNVTGIVDRLEARGLLERKQLTADRRVKQLVLTPEGRRLRRRVDSLLSTAPGLSTLAPAQQKALRDLLKRTLERGKGKSAPLASRPPSPIREVEPGGSALRG
jgi:DNA-binding MarR family transcriptional regulator